MPLVGMYARRITNCNSCLEPINRGFWFYWDSEGRRGYHYQCGRTVKDIYKILAAKPERPKRESDD